MGSLGSVKITKRPPPASVQFRNIQQEIVRQLRPIGQAHVDERNKITSDFDTDIKFGYRVSATQKQITLSVVVENNSAQVSEGWTVGDLWRALDKKGTRPHTIRPKTLGPAFGGALRFQWGGKGSYSPKTRPIGRSGGSGKASGPIVYRRQVNHPGFAPRKFSEVINKRLRKQFENAIDRGVRVGAKHR